MSADKASDPEPDAKPSDDPAQQEAHVPGHLREEAAAAAEPGRRQPRPVEPDTVKTLNLALQGGGSHGAFTWGVLDRLLEDDRIEFDSLCGTSRLRKKGPAIRRDVVIHCSGGFQPENEDARFGRSERGAFQLRELRGAGAGGPSASGDPGDRRRGSGSPVG
jgi:hypothetical protein